LGAGLSFSALEAYFNCLFGLGSRIPGHVGRSVRIVSDNYRTPEIRYSICTCVLPVDAPAFDGRGTGVGDSDIGCESTVPFTGDQILAIRVSILDCAYHDETAYQGGYFSCPDDG
jgi:hypothetical protein